MNYKIGQKLYSVYVGDEDENYKCELWAYIVRTKKSGFYHAIIKDEFTWVKLSKKTGDWGWAKSIPSEFRQKTPVGHKFLSLHTTKLAAWKAELTDRYTPEEAKPAIRRMITKYRNTKPKR